MENTGNPSRRNLPLVGPGELPIQRGSQLPSTLHLPGPEVRGRFETLVSHLETTQKAILQSSPLALTIRQVGTREFELQMHASRELTANREMCKELGGAISVFIGRECYGVSVKSAWFTGDQDSSEGVGALIVELDDRALAQKTLDVAVVTVIQIGRLLQVVDGHLSRLSLLLHDEALMSQLMTIGPRLDVAGGPGRMTASLSEGVGAKVIVEAAESLLDAGHLDLATVVLIAGMIGAKSVYERTELREIFLKHLVGTHVLDNDEDFEAAFALVADMLVAATPNNAHHRERLIAPCYDLVKHLLNRLQMPTAALELLKMMHGNDFSNLGSWGDHCRSALEKILDAAGGSVDVMEDLRHTLDPIPQDWARALFVKCVTTLFETKLARAVLESPQRSALRSKGFDFEYARGPEGVYIKPLGGVRSDQVNTDLVTITISNAGVGGFVPSEHGAGMVEYAESLLANHPSVDHVSTFCLPVIDFLMDHFDQLSPDDRPHLLALGSKVLKFVRLDRDMNMETDAYLDLPAEAAKSRAWSTLKRTQRLLEASVLHNLLGALPFIEPKHALNVVAWIHQNRRSLFSSLSTTAYDEIVLQMKLKLERFDDELAAHAVDPEAARNTIGPCVPSMAAAFRRAAVVYSPEATQALFDCWKTLSGEDDLSCHTRLLQEAQHHMTEKGTGPLSHAGLLVQATRAALERSLASPNPNLSAALEVYGELLLFIDRLQKPGPLPEWALSTLAEMAAEPLYGHLRQVNPNAAAWPFWLNVQLSLGRLSSDGCLARLSQCAKLPGVFADGHADTLFILSVPQLVQSNLNLDSRYPHALKAFEIWQSMPTKPSRSPGLLPVDSLMTLVSSLRKAIVDRIDTRVDTQRVMLALMGQLLEQDETAALEHLGAIVSSELTQESHPMLGVMLCLQFARHFNEKEFREEGDAVHLQQVLAMAFTCLPEDPQHRLEMRDLLEPFLSPT